MTLMQQWRNLTKNSFCILFPSKSIINYRQIISSGLYVRLKGTCSLAGRVFETPENNHYKRCLMARLTLSSSRRPNSIQEHNKTISNITLEGKIPYSQ